MKTWTDWSEACSLQRRKRVETLPQLVEWLRTQGYDNKKIQRILLGEGFSYVSIAESVYPPRSMEERVTKLREAGVSLRTIAGIPGMPPKSTLHLMTNPENRRKHNERFTTYLRQEKMKDEQLGLLLEAIKALTDAVRSVAVKIDAASK